MKPHMFYINYQHNQEVTEIMANHFWFTMGEISVKKENISLGPLGVLVIKNPIGELEN